MDELLTVLDSQFVGQREYKSLLSQLFYWQGLKLYAHHCRKQLSLPSPNVLIRSGSGTGKTSMIRALKEYSMIPTLIVNAIEIAAPNGHGIDFIEHLSMLYKKEGQCADYAIVFIDEIDKLFLNVNGDRGNSDWFRSIYTNLLTMMEPITVTHNTRHGTTTYINTKNMIFICAGVFDYDVKDTQVGFHTTVQEKSQFEIFKALGVPTEFLGRCTYFQTMNPLTDKEVRQCINLKINFMRKKYADYIYLHNLNERRIFRFDKKHLFNYYKTQAYGIRGIESELERIIVSRLPKSIQVYEEAFHELDDLDDVIEIKPTEEILKDESSDHSGKSNDGV